MSAINYKIEVFEGPMDLLLHLISKHKLNIYDIPIVELVEQYLAYVEEMKDADLEVASEFLEMAARLVYIKTVSLLPVYEEGDKLRQELSGELIEYAECKRVAKVLSSKTEGFNCIGRPQEHFEGDMTYTRVHDSLELLNAYMRVVGKRLRKIPPPLDSFRTIVVKKIVSVSSKIRNIVASLSLGGRQRFSDIILTSESRSDMVAAFLAILELAKTKHIVLSGDGDDMEIELIKVPEGELDFD
ncbi:MAG: serine protease [Ruminococcaceae bacterium]|nr:serine protease [Oscillospiraceae bacterium]MBR3597183.1 segregation/condensation protein A [Clostridia bacterium]